MVISLSGRIKRRQTCDCGSEESRGLCVCVSCSVVSDSLRPHGLVACQASLSVGFSRQEYWSGLFFLSPGDLPNPGIKPMSPASAGGFFTTQPPGRPILLPSLLSKFDNFHTTSLIHLELSCFLCQIGVTFLPPNFF